MSLTQIPLVDSDLPSFLLLKQDRHPDAIANDNLTLAARRARRRLLRAQLLGSLLGLGLAALALWLFGPVWLIAPSGLAIELGF